MKENTILTKKEDKNKNIIFVSMSSINLNTSATIRNRALIEGLIQNGNKVEVLTVEALRSNPFYDESIKPNDNLKINHIKNIKSYENLVKKESNIKGKIKNILLPLLRYLYHKFSIFDNTIYVAKKADLKYLSRKSYDIIISSSDPKSSHYAAKKLIESGLVYGKWIQYWGDPLAIDMTKNNLYPKIVLKYFERKLFSCSDKIVYVSPFTLDQQKLLYPQFSKKMFFIPIPYEKTKKIIITSNTNNIDLPRIGYFGAYHSQVRNALPLFNTCISNNYYLTIAGGSDLKLENSEYIKIFDRISKSKVDVLEDQCSILVCILNKSGTQIPGKVYHYAATNKPILIILDGEYKERLRNYFESYNRFVFCDNDEISIKTA
ncbi:MAG: hypothetical protein WC212_07190, partial [Candidatus Delongbacteria bacterium]